MYICSGLNPGSSSEVDHCSLCVNKDVHYIYVDTSLYPIGDPSAAAIMWSDRHKGIGSDGLVLIDRSPIPEADFAMRIFNADGSEAMMCGNASRCVGKYVYE